MRFKVGDRVTLSVLSDYYDESNYYQLNNKIGVVTSDSPRYDGGLPLLVEWKDFDGEEHANTYNHSDLELVQSASEISNSLKRK